MSTRSIIAIRENPSTWKGVYHHWDGYPSGVGETLLELGKTKGIDFIKTEIVNKHRAGWSTINKDWALEPENIRTSKNNKAPQYYPDGEGSGRFLSDKDEPGIMGTEYLYICEDTGINIYICMYIKGELEGERMIGMFGMGAPEIGQGKNVQWQCIGKVSWDADKTAMEDIENKEN